MKMMTKIELCFVIAAVTLAAGCGANENILRSGKETPTQANVEVKRPAFAEDLEAMKTAGFSYVYVLRRKDGGQIDAEDKKVIKANTEGVNRRVAADEYRAFLVGSNFQIPPKNMRELYEHFAIENYSPPEQSANVNANANTDK